MIYGGATVISGSPHSTWEWDGVWTQVGSVPPPDHVMTYDVARRSFLLFAGIVGFGDVDDTWTGGMDSTAADETCKFGFDADGDSLKACADPDCAGFCDPFYSAFSICADTTRPRRSD